MKRRWMLGLPVAIAGVLTGFWLGLPAATGSGALPGTMTGRDGGRRHSETGAAKGSGRTYAALIRQLAHAKGLPAAALRSIESASIQDLREILLEIAVTEGHPDRPEPEQQLAALMVAAAELFRREGVKALEWAAEAENLDLSLALMTAAAGQDPALMKEWFGKLGPHWEPGFSSLLIATAEREAALGSAEDLLAVEALFPGSLGSDFRGFAEGFDFLAYLKATRSPHAGEKAYGFWAARDPEAATQAVREVLGVAPETGIGGVVVHAMDGRAKLTGEAEAAGWIGGVVADLSGRTRELAIRGLARHSQSPDLIRQLASDGDRATFAATCLQANYHSLESAMPVLKTLPSQAVQAMAVGRWVDEIRDIEATVLDDVMEGLDLPADQREALRARLRPAR
jgi:hypothetical protein